MLTRLLSRFPLASYLLPRRLRVPAMSTPSRRTSDGTSHSHTSRDIPPIPRMDTFRSSLRTSWRNRSVDELRIVCRFHGIPASGNKAELVQRLMDARPEIPEQSARDVSTMRRSLANGGKRGSKRALYTERDNSDSESSDVEVHNDISLDADAVTDVDTSPPSSPIDTHIRSTQPDHPRCTTIPIRTSTPSRTSVATMRPDPESKYNSENEVHSDSADAEMSDAEEEWYDADPCSSGWRRHTVTHKRAKQARVDTPPATPTTTRTLAHAHSTSTPTSHTSPHAIISSSPSRIRPVWTNTAVPSSATTPTRASNDTTTATVSHIDHSHNFSLALDDSIVTSCDHCGFATPKRYDKCSKCGDTKQYARGEVSQYLRREKRQCIRADEQSLSPTTISQLQLTPADVAAIKSALADDDAMGASTSVSSSSIDATSRSSSARTSSSAATIGTVTPTPLPTSTVSKAEVEKALAGLYVQLKHFLINKMTSAEDADEERSLFGDSGNTRLVLHMGPKLNKREVNSLQSFCEAWLALIKCVCAVHPSRMQDYIDFLQLIVTIDGDYGITVALAYAEAVRLARQGANHVLAPLENDLYIKAVAGALGGKSKSVFTRTTDSATGTGIARRTPNAKDACLRFNREQCTYSSDMCKFQHMCVLCHGAHPATRCRGHTARGSAQHGSGIASTSSATGTHATTGKSSGPKRTATGPIITRLHN